MIWDVVALMLAWFEHATASLQHGMFSIKDHSAQQTGRRTASLQLMIRQLL